MPLNGRLLRYLAGPGAVWSAVGRGAGLLLGTLALFGLANLLVLPLLTWPGPGGTWPWGGAALLVALGQQRWLLRPRPGSGSGRLCVWGLAPQPATEVAESYRASP